MWLIFPLLLGTAGVLARQRRAQAGGTGWGGFLVWGLAGLLMTFSFLTGLSIGLFVLPLAATNLIWASVHSPHLREATGFVAGVAGMGLLAVMLNIVA